MLETNYRLNVKISDLIDTKFFKELVKVLSAYNNSDAIFNFKKVNEDTVAVSPHVYVISEIGHGILKCVYEWEKINGLGPIDITLKHIRFVNEAGDALFKSNNSEAEIKAPTVKIDAHDTIKELEYINAKHEAAKHISANIISACTYYTDKVLTDEERDMLNEYLSFKNSKYYIYVDFTIKPCDDYLYRGTSVTVTPGKQFVRYGDYYLYRYKGEVFDSYGVSLGEYDLETTAKSKPKAFSNFMFQIAKLRGEKIGARTYEFAHDIEQVMF